MTIYDIAIDTLDGKPTSLDPWRGRALLAVNVASECGLTPQYQGLQQLHEDLSGQGFSVLGFPCNQFGGQEPGSADDIAEFCATNYDVAFPMFEKIDVNGPQRHQLYQEFTRAADADGKAGDVVWNFEKFLISPGGKTVARFRPQTAPDDPDLLEAITRQLPQ